MQNSESGVFPELSGREVHSIDEGIYRNFAVMVPLVRKDGNVFVLFEKRSGRLSRQPGEICFPGGAREEGESSLENAVRETSEELLISEEQICILAHMDTLYTVYDNKVSVYMCELLDYDMSFSKSEVEEVFLVPLKFFLEREPESYQNTITIQTSDDFPYDKVPGGRNYHWRHGKRNVYFYEYRDRTIWGMTAYIMRSVVRILKTEAPQSLRRMQDDGKEDEGSTKASSPAQR